MPANRDETVILPWSVRIEQNQRFKHSTPVKGSLPLSNFDGHGSDLLLLLDAYLRGLYLKRLIKRDDEHFGRPSDFERAGRVIAVGLQGGLSGRERDIRLAANRADERLESSGIVWSTYQVQAVIPANALVGWVLVEKNGSDSLPGAWRKDFIGQFRLLHPQYTLKFAQVRMSSTWRLVENGGADRIASVEVARRDEGLTGEQNTRGFPRNVTKSRTDVYSVESGSMSGDMVRRIRRFFSIARQNGGVVEIDLADEQDDFGQDYSFALRQDVLEITLHAMIKGRSKTIRFNGASEPFETYVVEGLGATRVTAPRFRSDCRDHIKDLASASGVTLPNGWDTGEWPRISSLPAMEVRPDEDAR